MAGGVQAHQASSVSLAQKNGRALPGGGLDPPLDRRIAPSGGSTVTKWVSHTYTPIHVYLIFPAGFIEAVLARGIAPHIAIDARGRQPAHARVRMRARGLGYRPSQRARRKSRNCSGRARPARPATVSTAAEAEPPWLPRRGVNALSETSKWRLPLFQADREPVTAGWQRLHDGTIEEGATRGVQRVVVGPIRAYICLPDGRLLRVFENEDALRPAVPI